MMFQDALFPEEKEWIRQSLVYGTPQFRLAYTRYIASPPWRKICKKVRLRAKNRCEKCGTVHPRMEVHHVTYERFREEQLKDLLYLCKRCHDEADWLREQENHRTFIAAGEATQYENGFATYMTKKYGESYGAHYTEGDQEEFDEWLRNKDESSEDW